MSLLDEALANLTSKAAPCDLERALSGHPEMVDDVMELLSASKHMVPHSVAERVLANHGLIVRKHTIGRHRQGLCVWCSEQGRVFT